MAFWAVSKCDTPNHREKYAKKLKEYIDIDIFSRVSFLSSCYFQIDFHSYSHFQKKCLDGKLRTKQGCKSKGPTHNHVEADCFIELAESYWFYLAFENSNCNDYITEKLWRTFNLKTVPIVMGGGNHSRDAPERVICSYLGFIKDS